MAIIGFHADGSECHSYSCGLKHFQPGEITDPPGTEFHKSLEELRHRLPATNEDQTLPLIDVPDRPRIKVPFASDRIHGTRFPPSAPLAKLPPKWSEAVTAGRVPPQFTPEQMAAMFQSTAKAMENIRTVLVAAAPVLAQLGTQINQILEEFRKSVIQAMEENAKEARAEAEPADD